MKIINIIIVVLLSISLSAEIVNYSQLPEDIQRRVVPDLEGRVLINDLDLQQEQYGQLEREIPAVADGWPVSYTGSNCKNGAIYVNMDADADLEILFGVGTKITALNLDGSTVTGWPVQLSFYIWSSPAAGDIDGDGNMEIVCTSRNNTNANSGELYAFELDGTPCTGFPVTQAGGGTNNVCLYDLDSNGDMEILVNVRSHPQGWIYVFDGDGSEYPGFPQELDYIPGAGISAGDITGDGIPEIIALSYNKLHVYDLSGTLLPGFPLENTGYTYSYSQPILYDLDDDGLNEIIWGGCASSTGAVFVVNEDASSVTGWPQTTDYWVFGTVSLGDIDQDGSIDVAVGDQVSSGTPANHIYAWDASGSAIAGFPAGPTNAIYAQIGIADLDGDDEVELMIDDNNFGFGYDCYNHDGTHCTDWPIACGTIWSSTTMQITPVFGDVDNDGEIEIIGAATDIMNWVVECYLWETEETWNEDLAYMIIDGVNNQHNGLYEPSTSLNYEPPLNPSATVLDYNDVELVWNAPDGTGWIQWDTGETGNAIGLTGGGTFYSASRWEPANLIPYDGAEITKIEFFPNEDADFVIYVWQGANASTLVATEVVTSLTPGAFQEIVLSSPITIDASQELWFGYEVTHTAGGYPAGCDVGPAFIGYGDMISQDGGTTWGTLSELGLDYNWNLAAYVEGENGESVVLCKPRSTVSEIQRNISSRNPFDVIATSYSRRNRSLAGYKIYQDGVEVGEVADPATLTYLVESLDAGTYEFTITAFYTNPDGESVPTAGVTAAILLGPPINVEAQLEAGNAIITWDPPARGVNSYNVYRDDILIEEGIIDLMYIDSNTSSYWNITAVYDGDWESEFSETVSISSETDPNSILLVTDLNGNYPNPFNPETAITFSTSELAENTAIIIYNLKGQKIKTLVNEILPSGNHAVIWNGTDENGNNVSSGVYIYKMQAGKYSETKKMILMK